MRSFARESSEPGRKAEGRVGVRSQHTVRPPIHSALSLCSCSGERVRKLSDSVWALFTQQNSVQQQRVVAPVGAIDPACQLRHVRLDKASAEIAHSTAHGRRRALTPPDVVQEIGV
jgi:hypothetical protein